MIHSVSLPIAVACNSCLFENIIVAHFTELNFFKQAWGHHFQPCCVPVFHNASLIRATSGPSGMLRSNARRYFVAVPEGSDLTLCRFDIQISIPTLSGGVSCVPVTIFSSTHGRLALLWRPPLFCFPPTGVEATPQRAVTLLVFFLPS